jgi:hypothetical protein
MKITRMDLADTGSPSGLVTQILKIEKDILIPVPVDELAYQLDVEKITPLETAAFEGGLLTDEERSRGIILLNQALIDNPVLDARRRFTLGHELGHFLMRSHAPVQPGQFLCSRADMSTWSSERNSQHAKMEAQANEFSALLLMPPPLLRKEIKKSRDPNLNHVPMVARHFNVSKEAAARAYAAYHQQNIAIVVVKDGIVQRIHKGFKFPWITASYGKPVPNGSIFYKKLPERIASEITPTLPDNWISVEFGRRAPELYEQVYPQQNGYALLMLWCQPPEGDDDEDGKEDWTSKQRLQHRQSLWR